jgi:uncharacterized protein YeaO (DUF488 family)
LAAKTKSIYEPSKPGDGLRVLITRYYPRGVRKDRFDRRVVALSPSRRLLSSYRSGEMGWGEFSEAFLSELRANPESLEAIRALHELSKERDVTLLCYERRGLPCHRYIVRDLIASPARLSVQSGSGRGKGKGPAPTQARETDTFLLAKKRGRIAQK